MRSIPFIFGVLCVKMVVTQLSACPESCFCMDSFVTCSDFKFLDLTLLPPSTDTLVLTKGDVEEIPPGFLATATKLKMLELMAVNVRIVRGSAFRGLRQMELLSITSCSFDIVEPDGFSGLTEVGKIHISDSTFGRLGKHAFAYINNVPDFKIWSSSFETIADEAFYKLSDVFSFQFYHNNITTLGNNVFLGAVRLDDVAITMNRIHTVSKGSFESIAEGADRMMLNANTFVCSCDLAWLLEIQILEEYLGYNFCSFPGKLKAGASTFILSEISRDALCSPVPSTPSLEITTISSQDVAFSEHSDDFSIMEEVLDYDIHEAEEVHTDTLSKLSNDSASTPSTATTMSMPSVSSKSSSGTSASSSSSVPLSSSPLLPSSSFLALLLSTSPPPPPPQPSSIFSQPLSSPSPFSLTSLLNSTLITAPSQASSSSTPAITQSVDRLLSFSSNGEISQHVSSKNEIPPSPLPSRDMSSSVLIISEISSSISSDNDALSPVSSINEMSPSASSNNELSSSPSSTNELSSPLSSNNDISSSDLLNGDISSPASSNNELSSSVSSNGRESSSVSFNDEISSIPVSNTETSSSVSPTTDDAKLVLTRKSLSSISPNNESASSPTTDDAKLLLTRKSLSSVSPNNESASSPSTGDAHLVPTKQSSSFPPSAILPQSDPFLQVNPEPTGEESTIVTSQSPSSVSARYQSTEWPRDEEIVDNTEHVINIHDSQLADDNKFVHKQEASKETQQEINVHIITDKLDTADLGAQANSTAPTNTHPIVTNKQEHAIAYPEAAFAMADPSSHNEAQSSRCSCVIILLLGFFLLALIGNSYV